MTREEFEEIAEALSQSPPDVGRVKAVALSMDPCAPMLHHVLRAANPDALKAAVLVVQANANYIPVKFKKDAQFALGWRT